MSAFPAKSQTGRFAFGKTAEYQGQSSARLNSVIISLLTVVCLISMTGCYSVPSSGTGGQLVDGMFTSYRDRVWAARAYTDYCGGRRVPFGDHSRRGFIEGYCSVCRGGDGYVPAIPPKDYWTTQYQSEHGASCVNAWFEGYPEGAKAARNDNAGRFSNIYISQMVDSAITQQKTAVSLPSDIRVVRDPNDSDLKNEDLSPTEWPGRESPLPLPNRDWTMTFPDLRSAGDSSSDSIR